VLEPNSIVLKSLSHSYKLGISFFFFKGFNNLSIYCCGNQYEEYCCSQSELFYEDDKYLKPFLNETVVDDEDSSTGWKFLGVIFGILPLILVVVGVFFVMYKLRVDLSL
jgi:hypothetical protein